MFPTNLTINTSQKSINFSAWWWRIFLSEI